MMGHRSTPFYRIGVAFLGGTLVVNSLSRGEGSFPSPLLSTPKVAESGFPARLVTVRLEPLLTEKIRLS